MAVASVKIASIIGVLKELDPVINLCGQTQYFHPEDALSFYSDTRNFTPIFEENPYSAPLQALKDTVHAAGKELELLEKSDTSVEQQTLIENANALTDKMEALLEKRLAINHALDGYAKSIVEISHFLGLNLDLKKIFACKYIKVRFGRLPRESYDKLESYQDNPYILFFQCTSDKTHYWGVYFAPIEYADEIDRIFSGLFFERLRISATDSTPEERLQVLNQEVAAQQKELAQVEAEIDALWEKERAQFLTIYTRLAELDAYFGIRRYAAKYNNSFIVTGWIPAEKEAEFTALLDKTEGIEYTIENAEEARKHEPPVRLKNKKPFKPFEYFVGMYGLPQYNEVDPTPLVAITYVLLFGIMFGDLGQGLLVALVGYLMWKLKKMPLGRILIPCGISSAVFGTIFGSVFGFEHALDPMYQGLFHLESKPIEVMAADTTNYIIYGAVGIGVFLLIVAMLINIYSSFKRKNYGNALFGPNGVAGLVFYASLVFGLVGQMLLGISVFNILYIVFLIVLPLLCILFREPLGKLIIHDPDWKPESWGGYIMQNFFELFEQVLSYVTNTMSFMRVGAFVLVHAGMMMVVFTLAEMSSGFFYVFIIILGNILVSAMEGLLVGIQVLRLEFYEMFSRFFEGGGNPFTPVSVHPSNS